MLTRSEITYIGIDPGKTGGFGLIRGRYACVFNMPETDHDIVNLIEKLAKNAPCLCYMEKVGPMPKQGVSSVWTFGDGNGFLRGVICGQRLPLTFLPPRKWLNILGIRTKNSEEKERQNLWKKYLKEQAQHLFPGISGSINQQNADALLIALAGQRSHHAVHC